VLLLESYIAEVLDQ